MSAFGGNSNMSNSNLDPPRNNLKHANGYGDPRRNGNMTNKKKYTKPNGPFNNNNNNNGNNNNKRMGSNQDKKRNNAYIHNKKGGSKPPGNRPESNVLIQSDPLDIPKKVIPRQKPDKVQQYTPNEITSTGPLIFNPEQLGFNRNHKSITPRSIPKYLLHQPRLLVTPSFSQDAWDKQNQEKMLSMEEQNSGSDYQGLYEEFQKMREAERKQMETLGLVDAENISKDLTDAISFQGSCLDMCPIFERVRRALEKNVKALEKDPHTNKISRTRAIKAFSRPAAGQPPPLPSEVRPPHILKQTLDYLIENIVPQLPEAHSFIWDRTRSIRQDFTYQNFFGPEAIDCNERIVRIHLVSLHIMAGSDVEYSQQQELEQFNKALQTLIEIYQDVRNHGGRAPNEAEFRSYYLLSHIRDPELEREIQELPNDILSNKHVQLALMFRNMASQNNIVERGYHNSIGALNLFLEFFKIAFSPETPFLMSCLLETQFNEIRFYALKSMSRCYHTRGKAYSAESLQNFLGFDSLDKLLKFVQYYEIDILYDGGVALIDLFNKEKLETKYKLNSVHDKPKLAPPYSTQIDLNIQGKSLISFINCGESTYDLGLKQSDQLKVIELPSLNESIPKPSVPFNSTGFSTSNHQLGAANKESKSLSLTDFLNSSTNRNSDAKPVFLQPSNTQTKPEVISNKIATPQISFGSQNNQMPQMNVKPSFVFNAPIMKPEQPQQTPPPSTFSFESSASSTTLPSSNNKLTNSFNKNISSDTIPKFGGVNALQITQPKEISKPIISKENESPIASIMSKPIEKPKPMPTKLVNLKQFPRALNEVYSEILQNTINTELHRLLPKLIRAENSSQERNRVIKSLSNELYQAFMSEIIYKTTLEVKADNFLKNSLKLRTIKKLIKVGSNLKIKHEMKRKKINELHETSFNNFNKKRKSSSTSLKSLTASSSKKRHIWDADDSVNYIDEKQNEIRELWKPIDLKKFIESCSRDLKMNIEMKEIELKFLLIVEDWSSLYSKWLNTKLSLKINKERLIYENIVTNNKLAINFTSLPNNDYLNKDFFTNTSFLLFECGFVDESQVKKFGTIQDKLKRDQLVINKIINLSNKYSYYKMQILVVFWDIEQSKVSSDEVSAILNISSHVKNESILDITLCDMTRNDTSINEVLLDAFSKISTNFKGELTRRGLKKKERVIKAKEVNKHQSVGKKENVTDETFKAAENEALSKAKLSKRYQYLSKHLGSNTSVSNMSNVSNNSNSSFMTANNITIPNLAYPMNSTFLNLNTTGNNTTIYNGNESILTGFGNGVLEESTPFSSPKAKPFTKPNVQNIPRKLQQLRDLTAGIKARYKKK
ncbi:uncharacterized protein AC631_01936 [Debaryomyces fabryi]|uniref:Nuclear mRNA export factor n=1 Tax=Debaryomyces fabryi TaxID=58627 RepID=A0A0V1Q185_9ASCO|nr:uncharacterized protein AC631_01936 [Debaryomyces fabryi]KSA02286.1 hypothetical protein AC631_01936 [Debaryomyces fabryi]CUM47286.1 unnamed protein product [Debaryomyces fabryi]